MADRTQSATIYPFDREKPASLIEMDVPAFVKARTEVWEALKAAGAKCHGRGVGCGQAILDIELPDGTRWGLSLRPKPELPK